MSEYQYYEWQTADRLLTADEQQAVNSLSSHIEVSSSQAVVTYSWGDFKHNPRQVLIRFFDAHLYRANWGSRRLMFRRGCPTSWKRTPQTTHRGYRAGRRSGSCVLRRLLPASLQNSNHG